MATLSPVKYYSFSEGLAEKKFNLGSDTLRLALTDAAPSVSTHTQRSQITELAATGGYSAQSVSVSSSSQSGGIYSLVTTGTVTFLASGGSIGPFRYIVLFDDSATNDELICYFDIGESRTLSNGDQLQVDAGVTLLTLQ
jgi:hypothetical protein